MSSVGVLGNVFLSRKTAAAAAMFLNNTRRLKVKSRFNVLNVSSSDSMAGK